MYVTSTVSDVVSVKARLQLEVERTGVDLSRFVPGHPLAGREVSGAAAATADLFADRVWALCPSQFTDPDRLELVRAVVTALGAVAVVTTPESHDVAVALTSHTPQVVSSLVAAGLDPLEEADVRLSGQGLRDVTRLASSDPDLWTEILTSNAGPVAASLDGLIWRLGQVRDGLRQGGSGAAAVREALVAGNAGASKVPGKHGASAVAYAVVPVVIVDQPGELGRLVTAAAATGVNLEDVRIDHAAGRPTGLVELSVRVASAPTLKDGLRRDKAKTHILPISQLGLMEMTRQRHSESVRAAVYDDCPYCKGRGKVKSTTTMSVEIQRKLQEILKKRTRDETDFQLRIVVHPTVLDRLRTEDEKHLIEMEKRYFGKLSFRADTGMHAEQFKIVNVETNEELASVGA